eukprot:TRINITY_DN1066_c1_g2_i3.p1 TRINITY_DN1066_c1_g2~~TRINITY_DN1066_c1_g2_i3.p1  ORF type:complete len:794 (+),score=122.16 TRINITY_DN1066_c1_g2_i3:219-2600(+)
MPQLPSNCAPGGGDLCAPFVNDPLYYRSYGPGGTAGLDEEAAFPPGSASDNCVITFTPIKWLAEGEIGYIHTVGGQPFSPVFRGPIELTGFRTGYRTDVCTANGVTTTLIGPELIYSDRSQTFSCPGTHSVLTTKRAPDSYDEGYCRTATTCAPGYKKTTENSLCHPVIDIDKRGTPPESCDASPLFGNPIYPLTGIKRELVESGLAIGRLRVTFTYDSAQRLPLSGVGIPAREVSALGIGGLWSSSAHRRLMIQGNGARLSRGDGRVTTFLGNVNGVFSATTSADSNETLVRLSSGYRYTNDAEKAQEDYNDHGELLQIAWASGQRVAFAYSDTNTPMSIAPAPGYLISVTDEQGRSASFEYDGTAGSPDGQLGRIVDANGGIAFMTQDAQRNVTAITWADGSTQTFVYELATLPWALTGTVDGNGMRHASFGYDSSGRAISTEKAGGVSKYVTSYGTAPVISVDEGYNATLNVTFRFYNWQAPVGVSVATPMGSSIGLPSAAIEGRIFGGGRSQPAGSGCSASSSSVVHDSRGNVFSRNNFNGNKICYASDTDRNIETVRVEGLDGNSSCSGLFSPFITLPGDSRKFSTRWHPDWRLRTELAEPLKRTAWIYNGQPDPFNGGALASCAPSGALLPDGKPIVVLCKQVEQATTDTTGAAGLSATLQSGVANRTRQWTYNQYGQVLTEDGPRTDVSDVTTYVYYSSTTDEHTLGDLQQVTNAAGQVTSYPLYNKHGQVLRQIDPNGVITDTTYDLRQRPTSVSVGGQTTTYTYDPVGQLTRITQPDGSWVGYV